MADFVDRFDEIVMRDNPSCSNENWTKRWKGVKRALIKRVNDNDIETVKNELRGITARAVRLKTVHPSSEVSEIIAKHAAKHGATEVTQLIPQVQPKMISHDDSCESWGSKKWYEWLHDQSEKAHLASMGTTPYQVRKSSGNKKPCLCISRVWYMCSFEQYNMCLTHNSSQ